MDSQSNRNMQIGNICIQWSSLEYNLAIAIWTMLKIDAEQGKIVTASLDMKQRANMAFALANQINAPVSYRNAIKKVIDSLRDGLIDRRNVAVHGIHFPSAIQNSIQIEMHRGKGGRAPRTIVDKEFRNLGQEISDLTNTFIAAQVAYLRKTQTQFAAQSKAVAELETILRNISETNADAVTNGPS